MQLFINRLCWLCLLLPILMFCQQQNIASHSRWYSADNNSLPQNSVKSIMKDKYGFIWFTTEAGLICYDGASFKIYNNQNVPELTDNRMRYFEGSADNDSIFLWHKPMSYIMLHKRRVNIVDPKTLPVKYRFLKFRGEISYEVLNFHIKGGYFCVDENIVSLYLNDKPQWSVECQNAASMDFFECDNNLYAIDKKGKAIKFVSGKMVPVNISGVEHTPFTVVVNKVMRQAYIATVNNVFMLKANTNGLYLKPVLTDYDLSGKTIKDIFTDTVTGTLYLGTIADGLLIAKPKRFATATDSLKNKPYYAQLTASDSTILSASGEVYSKNGLKKSYPFETDNDRFMMLRDANGNIWNKAPHTLYFYSKKTGFRRTKKWYFKDKIELIYEDTRGNIFIGVSIAGKNNGRLYKYEKNGEFKFYMPLSFYPTFALSGEGNTVWLATDSGLFNVDLKTKKEKRIAAFNGKYAFLFLF